MKKTWTIAAAALLLGATLLSGCSAQEESFTFKEYTADAAQVQTLRLDVQDRRIEIVPSEKEQLLITYYESDTEGYDIALSEDNTLSMITQNNKSWTDFIGGKPSEEYRTIRLELPQGLLDSLDLSTTNEDLSVPAMSLAGSVSLRVNNGDITFDKLSVGHALTVESKNGDIHGTVADGVDAFTISSQVKKGESNLPEQMGSGAKRLTATANNGDIAIEFEP